MRSRLVPELLRDVAFRRYWSASTVSMFGDQISGIALPLAAVLALHAGAVQMGYLTALEWLPSLLFGLPAGAWVDRRGRRRATMITADLGRAALFAAIPVLYALHVMTLAQLYAVTFGAGTLSIVFNVADSSLFVSLVAPERYLDGQSLLNGSRALSYVGGPSVGGLLVQVLTAPVAIVANALSFLGSAFFLSRIRPAEPPADDSHGSVLAGARFIAGSGIVRASLIAVATVNFFNLMFNALYLLYAVRVLHIRAGVVGLLIGVAALGGLLGALVTKRVAARIGAGWAYAAGCGLFTAPAVLWPLAHGPLLLVLAMLFTAEFATGFGVMMLDISIGAIFAAVIPAALRSRVTGAFQAVNYGTRPLGAVLGGLIGASLGLRPALWVAALGGVAGTLLLLPTPLPGYRLPADLPRHLPVDGPPRAGLLRVIAEGAARQVPAPGNLRGDPQVHAGAELAGPLDQLGRAVHPQEPRRPRAGGHEVVDDQGDLGVARLDVEELPGPLGRAAPDPQVRPVELETHRRDVGLVVRADGGDPGQRL
jgi:MFS family permease